MYGVALHIYEEVDPAVLKAAVGEGMSAYAQQNSASEVRCASRVGNCPSFAVALHAEDSAVAQAKGFFADR